MRFPPETQTQLLSPHVGRSAPEAQAERHWSGLLAFVLAIWFSAALIWLAFWLIPLEEWKDLFNYVQRYSLDPYYGSTPPIHALDYLTGEYGWQLIVQFIFHGGYEFSGAFFLISVFSLALTTYSILKRTRDPLLLIMMINPAMIDFFASQVRSALAFSIVFWAVLNRRLMTMVIVVLAGALIHTSMVLMLVPISLSTLLNRSAGSARTSEATFQHIGPLTAVLIAFALANIQAYLLDLLGDRRAIYVISELGAGVLYTLGWAAVGIFFYFTQKMRGSLESIMAMFFFAMFFFASIYEFYAHRYIPYAIPFAAVAIGRVETIRIRKYLFLCFYSAFSLVYFSYWL